MRLAPAPSEQDWQSRCRQGNMAADEGTRPQTMHTLVGGNGFTKHVGLQSKPLSKPNTVCRLVGAIAGGTHSSVLTCSVSATVG